MCCIVQQPRPGMLSKSTTGTQSISSTRQGIDFSIKVIHPVVRRYQRSIVITNAYSLLDTVKSFPSPANGRYKSSLAGIKPAHPGSITKQNRGAAFCYASSCRRACAAVSKVWVLRHDQFSCFGVTVPISHRSHQTSQNSECAT